MQYDVRALSADNRIVSLVVEAASENDVRRELDGRGLFAAAITPARRRLAVSQMLARRRGLSLSLFSQELLALLNAGLGIVESLEALLEKEAAADVRAVLTRVLDGLREGKRLSTALAEQPDVFPPLYSGIIKAAEGTSDLPRALARYLEYQHRTDAVRSKVVSASIYPAILLLVGGGVTLFLLTYVVPRFADVYRGAGRELPWLSQRMLEWGTLASTHRALVLPALAIVLVAFVVVVRRLLTGDGATHLLSRFPAIGERVRLYWLSRLYLTLGMLLEGGIPILRALHTVESVTPAAMRAALGAAAEAVRDGAPLSDAFDAHQLTTPVSVRMMRVGERTGKLGQMLSQSAAFHDGELGRWIERFTRTFEPLLMAAIGLVIGAIVVMLYIPIFDLAGSFA